MNKNKELFNTTTLKKCYAEKNFLVRGSRGSIKRGLYLLNKLDDYYAKDKKSRKSNKR